MRIAKSPTELGFSRYDAARLERALKHTTDRRTFQRVQAVLLVARGHPISEVAEVAGVSTQTVYNWVGLYLDHHEGAALADAPRPGRPRQAQPITTARILRELARHPLRLGYRTTVWTVALLAERLSQRYQCPINRHTLRRRMKAIGLRCKRPRYFYEEKAPHRAQKKGLSSGG
jgi:transposase